MGEKDITEKILEDHNDVFADIINGLIFAGEQRILPESLENTAVHSQYKADDEKVHELERDVAKYWKDQPVLKLNNQKHSNLRNDHVRTLCQPTKMLSFPHTVSCL